MKRTHDLKQCNIMRTEIIKIKDEQSFVICYSRLLTHFDSVSDYINCMVNILVTQSLLHGIRYSSEDIINDIVKDFGIQLQSDTFNNLKSYITFLKQRETKTRLSFEFQLLRVLEFQPLETTDTLTLFWGLITDLLNNTKDCDANFWLFYGSQCKTISSRFDIVSNFYNLISKIKKTW